MTTIKSIVEIPANSTYKYELKGTTLTLDRVIKLPIPFNYGYIIGTLAPDQDQLDVFILSTDPIQPLTLVDIEILGGFKCLDNGIQDDKLLAKIKGDDCYISDTMYELVKSYLSSYKDNFVVEKFLNKEQALEVLNQAKI